MDLPWEPAQVDLGVLECPASPAGWGVQFWPPLPPTPQRV